MDEDWIAQPVFSSRPKDTAEVSQRDCILQCCYTVFADGSDDCHASVASYKQHIAECCYSITNGCWRDCLVRFAYDPRENKESRL